MSYPLLKNEIYTLLGGINNKVSEYNNDVTEFRDITNMHFSTPGALTKRPGTESYSGATVQGRITGAVEFNKLDGASYIVATANTNAYTVSTSTFSSIRTGLTSGAITDFVTFVDRLFVANGAEFFVFDGTNTTNFSLPNGITGSWGVTAVSGGSLTAGTTGTFVCAYAYVNDRGAIGPISNGITITIDGSSNNSIGYVGLTAPTGFGVTAIQLFRTAASGSILFGTTTTAAGTTTVTDTGFPLTATPSNNNLYFTLAPRYIELYNNQLFLAGFSNSPSTAYWSEIGKPDSIDPTYFAEFRTNDGDRITGMRSYFGSLIVTKRRSFHRVTGNDPTDFVITQISDEYGSLSNKSMVVWEDFLWFLDEKGVVEYNGANIRIVSTPIQPIIDAMNIEAAIDNATAIHYRRQNEVWFAIPCNGSTFNNCILVYDYLVKAWTKYEGPLPSHLFMAQGDEELQTPFFGSYTGSIFNFGESLTADSGAGITCSFLTHFTAARGQTQENQYRRFYLDVDPVVGTTAPVSVNFRANYGDSNVISRTMYQTPFQSRIDFGIPARSIQAEVVQSSPTLGFKVNGYTFSSRFQRDD